MGAPGAVETEEQEINPPVKMRLERSAERDKREIKIILPLNMRKAHAARIPNRPAPPGLFCALPKNPGKKQAHLPLTNAAALL
jgi:hypothetical protein